MTELELGKKSAYDPRYNPDKLFPISRKLKRDEIQVPEVLPFKGYDLWNHYEVSWLNASGKPIVALAQIVYDCSTPNIIESKSMKLYFNSFNNTRFGSLAEVQALMCSDLTLRVGGAVTVTLTELHELAPSELQPRLGGVNLDDLDIACHIYQPAPELLKTEDEIVDEVLSSNLLKSNCLVTYQPDWGSVEIRYSGHRINHAALLQYIVSFRDHNEFHEQCIERIFMDILRQCQPLVLTVVGRYTRRGGLDINPVRTNQSGSLSIENVRLIRQ